jgi:hypothetical protein
MLVDKHSLDTWADILWGLVLLTLPVTSFRFFPYVFGHTLIRPLALYPLSLLLIILILRATRQKRLWLPVSLAPLVGFLVWALLSSASGSFLSPVELRDQVYWERSLRAWVSLGIGLAFLWGTIWMNRQESDLHRSLRWLYLGLLLSAVWGGVQILAIQTDLLSMKTMSSWQRLFSIRGLTPHGRISGLAYEPSWLANQLLILYLPWLFAALLTGYRVSKYRWVELLLLVLSLGLLVFSLSRSGVLTALVSSLFVALVSGWGRMTLWLRRWFFPSRDPQSSGGRGLLQQWLIRVGLIVLLLMVLFGVWAVMANNPYFSILWTAASERDLLSYIIEIKGGARLAYAVAGWKVFAEHPWAGVGLGASGFYLFQNLPDWSLTFLPEVERYLSPISKIFLNPKNLYVRLLAETGVVGFWLFVAFLLVVLGQVLGWLSAASRWKRFVGVAGLFIWIAVALNNLTQDSFAMPNMWVSFGLLLGLGWGMRTSPEGEIHPAVPGENAP